MGLRVFHDFQTVRKKTQKINLFVKFAEFRLEFSQNNWSEFVFEKILTSHADSIQFRSLYENRWKLKVFAERVCFCTICRL